MSDSQRASACTHLITVSDIGGTGGFLCLNVGWLPNCPGSWARGPLRLASGSNMGEGHMRCEEALVSD